MDTLKVFAIVTTAALCIVVALGYSWFMLDAVAAREASAKPAEPAPAQLAVEHTPLDLPRVALAVQPAPPARCESKPQELSLDERDAFFDLALQADFPPDLWRNPDVRDAFRRNGELRAIASVIDLHHLAQAEAWKWRRPGPSLKSRIDIHAAGLLEADDLDAWHMIDSIDLEYSEQYKHGADLEQYECRALWTLRKYIMAKDQLAPLIAELTNTDGAAVR